MLLRYYQVIELPLDAVEAAFAADGGAWIPGLVERSIAGEDHLLAEVGLGRLIPLRKIVEIKLQTRKRLGSTLVVPITWKATGTQGMFPVLEGGIEVSALGSARTQLGFSASYRPPLEGFGRFADRALLHRVAEATAKDFVDRVAGRVEELAAARYEASDSSSGSTRGASCQSVSSR